ncbi:MAG: hypothetical protein AB7E31_06655 [Desulfitobacterium sp.]
MESQLNESNVGNQVNSLNLSELKAALLLVVEQGFEMLKEVSQKPLEVGGEVTQKACEQGEKVINKGVEAAKEHPTEALLIAFGLGFLAAKIFRRK